MSEKEITEEELKIKIGESSLSYFLPHLLKTGGDRIRGVAGGWTNNINVFDYNLPNVSDVSVNPAFIKNKIFNFGSDPNADSILRFLKDSSNYSLSNLVPFIRIYKIYKKKNNEVVELELPFDDHSGYEDITNIFATKTGRGAGIGLISFDWKSMAKNEANMAQFSAQLKLFVQDVTELEKIRNQDSEGRSVSLLDLIYPQLKDSGSDPSLYDKNELSLKMVVGWYPKGGEDIEKYGVTAFFLTLVKHNFEFQEDGSIVVTIDFIASIELDFNDPMEQNCLIGNLDKIQTIISNLTRKWKAVSDLAKDDKDQDQSKRKRLMDRYDEDVTKINNLSKNANIQFPGFNNPGGVVNGTNTKPLPNDDGDKLAEKRDNFIKNFNNAITEEKINILKDCLFFFNTKDLIYSLVLNKEQIKTLLKIYNYGSATLIDDDILNALKTEKDKVDSSVKTEKTTNSMNNEEILETVNDATDNSDQGIKIATDEINAEIIKKIRENLEKQTGESDIEVVPYIHLYDIVNFFVNRTSFLKENKVILGNFTYKSFNLNRTTNDVVYKKTKIKDADGEEVKITKIINLTPRVSNIGQIPISLSSFINWFTSNVIEKDIKKMSIGKFLNKIMKELVPLNINTKFIKFFPSYKFSAANYTAIVDEKFEQDRKELLKPVTSNGIRLSEKAFYDIKKYSVKEQESKKISKFLFVLSDNEDNITLEGNFEQDWSERGVYHFYVGEENGILKTLSFSREDNPRLEAAQLQSANPEKNADIVRHIYSANLELFGNTFFEPGHLIYINPTYPGVGIRNTSLFRIGLGGYYRVITVNSFIESGVYKTTLSCKWEAFGGKQTSYEPTTQEQGEISGVQLA